jgi:hypothetical protein
MRRLLLFLLLAVPVVNAQEKGDIEIGISAGINTSHTTAFNGDNVTPKFGYNLSLSAEYFISEAWGFKTRLAYDQKGWVDIFINTEETRNIRDYNLDYLTVPFLITHHAGKNRNFHMHVGPYIGFLLGAEADATGLDLSYVFHNVDLGISYAVGYKLNITEHIKIFTEFEVSAGLLNIFAIDANVDYTVVNGRTSLNFGVLFDL